MKTVAIFGIPIARIAEAEAVERIIQAAKARRAAPQARPGPFLVATLNVDFVCNAVRGWPFGGNDELLGYLKDADMVTADGMPIVMLSRFLGSPIPERVTGADMVPEICRRAAEEGLSIYVLGGDKGAVEEALVKMGWDPATGKARDGGRQPLKIAGIDNAFVDPDGDQTGIVGRINAAKPDILVLALKHPKQELWLGRNAAALDANVAIGVGGTFNFIAGRVRRAPKWVQRSGLEWIYRIIQEPCRLWRRYAYGLVKFSWLALRLILGGCRK